MSLADFIALAEPWAEEILSARDQMEEIGKLGDKLAGLRQDIDTAKAKLKKSQDDAKAAQASIADAKTFEIESKAWADKLVVDAREAVSKIINDAKEQARTEAEVIKKEYKDTIAQLEKGQIEATIKLRELNEQIRVARVEHETVLASMASLAKRLGG